jgi:hypothetical protein
MTICVAAICKALPPHDQYYMVVGAADRMLTAGDIEFEPEQPKIVSLTPSVFVLLAGDSALQTEIMQNVYRTVVDRVATEPKNWWKVHDVAQIYSDNFNKARLKRAQASILQPLGLTLETFGERQRVLSPEFVRDLSFQLQTFEFPRSVAAIVCGVDLDGAHIAVVRNSQFENVDAVGFAAIGAGDWHANSQFMFSKHTRARGFAETLLLTYSAKRRAEVAPGVGSATDMFTVGPFLGNCINPVGDHVINKLNAIHEDVNSRIRQSEQESKQVVSDFVTEVTRAVPNQQVAAPPVPSAAGTTPTPETGPAKETTPPPEAG